MTIRVTQGLLQPTNPKTPDEVFLRFNEFLELYKFQINALSFESNFNGFIANDVSIGAGATISIQHFLGVKPKWRILLRQTGNGVITDVPLEWTDKVIVLKNEGAVTVVVSLLIARG
jgi:hypothetical protein